MNLLLFALVFYLADTGKSQDCICTALANTGNCDFYTQCVEPKFHCGINGYPLAYGYRYCHHFTNNQSCFTSIGQKLVDNVKSCLMKAILNSNIYNSSGRWSQLQTFAINSHQSCYTDNGFCNVLLSIIDLNCLAFEVFNLNDYWNKQAIQQILQTATTCTRQDADNFLFNVDNWIYNAIQFVTCQLLQSLKDLRDCGSGLDIFFVLDASGSILEKNFVTMKDFVKSIVSNFEIGADKTHVGVIRLATSASIIIPLGSINNASQLNTSITNIVYTSGKTFTDLALNLLDTAFSNARTSQGVPQVAIVFTDGQSTSPNSTFKAAQAVHSTSLIVYSFGIGKGIDINELNAIASSSSNVFVISNFSAGQFATKLLPLQKATCTTLAIVSINELLTTSLGMGKSRLLLYPFPEEGRYCTET